MRWQIDFIEHFFLFRSYRSISAIGIKKDSLLFVTIVCDSILQFEQLNSRQTSPSIRFEASKIVQFLFAFLLPEGIWGP